MIQKGLKQAISVTLYCSAVGLLIFKGEVIFDKMQNFFGPIAFLLLFSTSALVCGLLVFYQPYKLFFDNKKKDAADLVVATTGWLFIFFFLFLLANIIT